MDGGRTKPWGRADEIEDVSGQVAIVGVGEAEHTAASGRDAVAIGAQAVERALEDAGLEPEQVDGLMFRSGMGPQLDEKAFHAHFGTRHDLWVSREGGAMTWAGSAPAVAAEALRSGRASVIVNVFSVDWASRRGSMTGGPGAFHAAERFKASLEAPFGWFPQPVYFATIARRHMHEYGTTPEQLGAIAVTCRQHANGHPTAVMRERPLTLEQYLAEPMLADPLRVPDCCLISDGGGAYVMTTPERARDGARTAVSVLGVGVGRSGSGTFWSQQGDFTATPQAFAAPAAFAMAGIGPDDVDVLATYDPFTIVALMQIEDMGFCAKGEAGALAAAGHLAFDSDALPYNTHGGLLSHAYVLGIAHVVELVRQLRGEAANQVPNAEVAVYGGYTGADASTLVLARAA
ncbi:MAG: thiolase family protein [Myxococcota bacterium]|nr:thiolase family protein [Myxococcota bacterium]